VRPKLNLFGTYSTVFILKGIALELVQENETSFYPLNEEQKLWKIADSFRMLVCTELRNLGSHERAFLRGDYLFKIDGDPRFIVMVDESGSWSVCLSKNIDNSIEYEIDSGCHWSVSKNQVINVIEGSARSTILTDSNTLYKLLIGTLKAHIAFVTGKVTIAGDLSAFLKMVSLLKLSGVKPKNEKRFQSKL
jgi:putative sterol carrier protein